MSFRPTLELLGLFALPLALAAGACSDDPAPNPVVDPGDEGGGGSTPVPEGLAHVRVVHASPDAPAVDIWVDGADTPLVENLAYGDASAYLEVPAGDYDLAIKASPSSAEDEPVYRTGLITLAEQHRHTAIAAGSLASTASGDKFRVLSYTEAFGPAGSGSAIVRVVHASSDAPTVGIDLHDDDPSAPEISNLDRFTATAPEGFALNAGEALQIGITAGGARVTAFTTPELPEGAEIFVIATGEVSKLAREAQGFSLLAVGPDGAIGFIAQNPLVYALHASPDAPAVDLFAGDAELVAGIAFGELAGPLQLPPGSYGIDFFPADPSSDRPAGPPAASADTGMLEAGERYLTIATGTLAGGQHAFQLTSYAEGFDLEAGGDEALLRVVHSAPDAPAVDLGILNVEGVVNPVLVSDVSFAESSDPAGLSSGVGTIPLGVTPAGMNSQIVASFHVTTAGGMRAFGVAAGALDPTNGEPFRLLVVDTATSLWSATTVHPQP